MYAEKFATKTGKVVPINARTRLQRVNEELMLLRQGLARIDPNSREPEDLWAIPIYLKLIRRRERLSACLAAS